MVLQGINISIHMCMFVMFSAKMKWSRERGKRMNASDKRAVSTAKQQGRAKIKVLEVLNHYV